jgi:hypothetical protein
MGFTLEMSHPGMMGDLVFQVFGVDQTGNFVFSAEPRANVAFQCSQILWNGQ